MIEEYSIREDKTQNVSPQIGEELSRYSNKIESVELKKVQIISIFGSRPSDHYFRSVCWFVCLSVCLFVCAGFFSAVFDPISIKLGHVLYVWV